MLRRKLRSFIHLVKNGELTEQLKRKYYLNTNHNPKKTILISGSGRSGTTWLSQILNYDNRFRYIFEPFYPERVDFCDFFVKKQYLRATKNYPKHFEAASKILTGNFRNSFIDRYNQKFFCNKRLVKDVEINLFLGWLDQNFKDVKKILITRHPCAVANSWVKLGWDTHQNSFLSQKELIKYYLSDFEKEIQKAKTKFEKAVFLWSIETYVPMKQIDNNLLNVKQITYENLCENFEDTVYEVFQYIGEKFDTKLFEARNLPSYTTRPYAAILKGRELLQTWQNELSKEQIKKAKDIVSLFELDNMYEI